MLIEFACLIVTWLQVLSVNITTIPYAYARTGRPPPSLGQASLGDTISIVIGDPWEGGARAQLTFPYLPGWVMQLVMAAGVVLVLLLAACCCGRCLS